MVEGVHFDRGRPAARSRVQGDRGERERHRGDGGRARGSRSARSTLTDDVDASWVDRAGRRDARVPATSTRCRSSAANLSRGEELAIVVTVTGEVAPGAPCAATGARARRPGRRDRLARRLGRRAARLARSAGRVPTTSSQRCAAADRPAPGRACRRGARARGARSHRDDGRLRRPGDRPLAALRGRAGSGHGSRCRRRAGATAAAPPLERGPRRGGEDYELLATLPDPDAVERGARRSCGEAFGVDRSRDRRVIVAGRRRWHSWPSTPTARNGPLEPDGWDHFR